jgi:hypothetical protein
MLSGLTAVAIMPIAAVLTRHSAADIIGILLLAILILFAHRKNIAELILQKHVEGRAIAQDRDGNR